MADSVFQRVQQLVRFVSREFGDEPEVERDHREEGALSHRGPQLPLLQARNPPAQDGKALGGKFNHFRFKSL